jgi:hypothetical protein
MSRYQLLPGRQNAITLSTALSLDDKYKFPGGRSGFLKSKNRPNAEGIAHHRAENLLDFECHREESSTSRPPDLSSDDSLFSVEGEILSRALIPSLDQLE